MSSNNERLYQMKFSDLYQIYLSKLEKKSRTKFELNQVIEWIFSYTQQDIEKMLKTDITFGDFIKNAKRINPDLNLVTGVVCNIRVEEISDETMHKVRVLDKMVDELAKGKDLEKVLRKEKAKK